MHNATKYLKHFVAYADLIGFLLHYGRIYVIIEQVIKLCEDNLKLIFVAETLVYALNTLSDISDTLNDDTTETEKTMFITEIIDNFYEWANIKKREFETTREEIKKLPFYLDNKETFEAV